MSELLLWNFAPAYQPKPSFYAWRICRSNGKESDFYHAPLPWTKPVRNVSRLATMHTRNRPFSRPPECMHVKSKCAEWWWSGTNGAQRYEVHGQAWKEPGGSERAEDGNKTFDTKQLRLAVMQQQRRYRSCGAV